MRRVIRCPHTTAPCWATRISVDRAFVIQGVGLTVVSAAIDGHIDVGDRQQLTPGISQVRVRDTLALDQTVGHPASGERCRFDLSDVERGAVSRGSWPPRPGCLQVSTRVDVRFSALARFALPRLEFRAHLNAAARHVLARIGPLSGDNVSGVNDRPYGAIRRSA